jgi:hypothetical protein
MTKSASRLRDGSDAIHAVRLRALEAVRMRRNRPDYHLVVNLVLAPQPSAEYALGNTRQARRAADIADMQTPKEGVLVLPRKIDQLSCTT